MTRSQKNTTTQASEPHIDEDNSGNLDDTATQEKNTISEPSSEKSSDEKALNSTENPMIQSKEPAQEPVGDDSCSMLVEPTVEAGDLSIKPLETILNEETTPAEALDVYIKESCSLSPEMMIS